MRSKFWILVILLPAVIAALIFFSSRKSTSTAGNNSVATSSAGLAANSSATRNNSGASASASAAGATSTPENLAAKAGELPPPPPVATNVPPLIILQNARRAIIQYAQMFGGNPVGTNPEITAALLGGNPRHVNFITPDSGLHVNDKGEMLDAWGTPLFFHQISGHEMEIRSAGEDRKMWTFDDLLTR